MQTRQRSKCVLSMWLANAARLRTRWWHMQHNEATRDLWSGLTFTCRREKDQNMYKATNVNRSQGSPCKVRERYIVPKKCKVPGSTNGQHWNLLKSYVGRKQAIKWMCLIFLRHRSNGWQAFTRSLAKMNRLEAGISWNTPNISPSRHSDAICSTDMTHSGWQIFHALERNIVRW